MRTMVSNATITNNPVAALLWYTGWYITCSLLPRTTDPFRYVAEAGLKALVLSFPAGVDGLVGTGFVPAMYQANPIPGIPYLTIMDNPCVVSGCLSRGTFADYPSWSVRSRDNTSLLTLLAFPLACSSCANLSISTCQGTVQKIVATLTADSDSQDLTSTGAVFLYAIVGIGFLFQMVFVVYTMAKRRQSYTCLHIFVLFAEGFVCGGLRAFRQFAFPTFGGLTGNVSSGEGMWLLDANASLEGSLSLATTLMTVAVYIKVVLASTGLHLSKKNDRLLDLVVGILSILMFAALCFLSVIYPFQPWLQADWAFVRGIGNAKLKEISGQPPFIINIILLCAYVLVTFAAMGLLVQKAKVANSTAIMGAVKRLLKYIVLQIVGMAMVVASLGLRADYTLELYYSGSDRKSVV